VKFWARWYVPEAILGANTEDELEQRMERDITPAPEQVKRSPLQAKLSKVEQGDDLLHQSAEKSIQEREHVTVDQENVDDILSDEEKAAILAAEKENGHG